MNNCGVVQDLIPLYVEGLANEDSVALVEQHVAECQECRSYYERIKQDFQSSSPKKPDPQQLGDLLAKLAKYQQRIKLVGVLAAMLLSCIITGAGVAFLSTLPFLILTPFACRLLYNKSLPILLSAIPFGILGGVLSAENSSYIPFFTVITFLAACIGVGAGALVKGVFGQIKARFKALYLIEAAALLLISCSAYFSLYGNPIGYVEALNKSRDYVNRTYEKGALTFKGVGYNFKDHRHYGKFEYVLNGKRQVASIGFFADGNVDDYYKFVLDTQFCEERSADLKSDIAAAINFLPVTLSAVPEEKLSITQDEINSRYDNLSYDLEKRNKATALRKSESSKLNYELSFGAFHNEYTTLSKDEFLAKTKAIQKTLQERQVPFHSIEVKAQDSNGNLQSLRFTQNSTEQELINSYELSAHNRK